MKNFKTAITFILSLAATLAFGLSPWVREDLPVKAYMPFCLGFASAWWVWMLWCSYKGDSHANSMLDMGAATFVLVIPFLILQSVMLDVDLSIKKIVTFAALAVIFFGATKLEAKNDAERISKDEMARTEEEKEK